MSRGRGKPVFVKRSVLAVVMAGVLVLASPNPAWAYNRDVEMKIAPVTGGKMRFVVALSLRPAESPPDDCRADVPVNIQRRVNGVWTTRFSGRTNSRGRLRRTVSRRRGYYRAVAKEFTTAQGNQCFEAVSSTMRF